MRILVFGAGAVGSVLGGYLARQGHAVTLLGRAWHLEVIRQEGLRIGGLWGEHRVRQLAVATRVADLPPAPAFDWIFLCVKSPQTVAAVTALPALLGPRTLVCAFQNGLGNYEALVAQLPPERVALGRVIFGVALSPGCVTVTVYGGEVLLGSPASAFPPARLAELAQALAGSGIPSRTTSDILTALWAKVLYNCALNGLSTVLEAPYGALPAQPASRRLMEQVIAEAYPVAAAQGVPLEPPTPEAYLALLFGRLIPDTAAHYPSMLQDIRRGRATEIEALNGALARLGRAAGLPTPANALITRLVHAKEQFAGIRDCR